MDRKIKLKTLNPHITCYLCKGYLIEATAITECLHTFCKSCIIKHLEANTNCPTCNIVIHHSYPRQYINFDRTMQDIVYKLVPNLYQNEMEREKEFYKQRGLPYPKEVLLEENHEKTTAGVEKNESDTVITAIDIHPQQDELINVRLECILDHNSNNSIKNLFIRVPTKTTILHLKKCLALKIWNNLNRVQNIDILDDCDLLDKNDNLKSICISKIKNDEVPFLVLQCKLRT